MFKLSLTLRNEKSPPTITLMGVKFVNRTALLNFIKNLSPNLVSHQTFQKNPKDNQSSRNLNKFKKIPRKKFFCGAEENR